MTLDRRLCDFYDWTSHRACNEPATWSTHQCAPGAAGPVSYYSDAHRPPRAHPLTVAAPPAGAARPASARTRKMR